MISEKIKQERERIGISQKRLAELLNVDMQTVWRWENGSRSPRDKMKQKLADIFGVTVSYLMSDDSDINTAQRELPVTQPREKRIISPAHNELPPNVKKIRGKTYMDGVALDTLAHQLRDRLIIELCENDEKTREEIKDTLHDCLRLYTDHEVSHKTA